VTAMEVRLRDAQLRPIGGGFFEVISTEVNGERIKLRGRGIGGTTVEVQVHVSDVERARWQPPERMGAIGQIAIAKADRRGGV
jgi:hypothetical protein